MQWAIAQRYMPFTEQRISREAMAKQIAGETVSQEFSDYYAYVEAAKAGAPPRPRVETKDFSPYEALAVVDDTPDSDDAAAELRYKNAATYV